ncbi:hypothetical protein FE257_000014 [Aspergillus nanangensis]|uniref:Uncharacterized protein n=1 Tax=Aspergillus nanangensis TaxID=2582783 RepID=A0AAD4D0J6_ASPNN|nr:hypothetical protein FE257_000014 [Aspergillus nanangensis]
MDDQPPGYQEATSSIPPSAAHAEAQAPLKGQDTRYAMLTLAGGDRIRLLRFPEPITAVISEVTQQAWPKGIQAVRPAGESLEIKFKGNPFTYDGDPEKIAIRLVLLGVLDALATEGWGVLPAAGGLGRLGKTDGTLVHKENLIFRRVEPRSLSWLCLSFDSGNLLHLMRATDQLATGIMAVFAGKVEQCNKDLVSGHFEIKLAGKPWNGSGDTGLLVMDLLQCLNDHGYILGSSVELDGGNGGDSYKTNGEVWFCYRY